MISLRTYISRLLSVIASQMCPKLSVAFPACPWVFRGGFRPTLPHRQTFQEKVTRDDARKYTQTSKVENVGLPCVFHGSSAHDLMSNYS